MKQLKKVEHTTWIVVFITLFSIVVIWWSIPTASEEQEVQHPHVSATETISNAPDYVFRINCEHGVLEVFDCIRGTHVYWAPLPLRDEYTSGYHPSRVVGKAVLKKGSGYEVAFKNPGRYPVVVTAVCGDISDAMKWILIRLEEVSQRAAEKQDTGQ